MNIKSIITVAVLAASAVFASCDNEPDLYAPQTKDFCGQWVCTLEIGGEVEAEGVNVLTYNTAADDDNIWVSDQEYIGFTDKAKAVDFDAIKFAGETVENGQIFRNAVKVRPQELTGEAILADSIDFVFKYDDGEHQFDIHYHGYRYTGWEDYID